MKPIPPGHRALQLASGRSSTTLADRVAALEEEVARLRAALYGEGPAVVRDGERVRLREVAYVHRPHPGAERSAHVQAGLSEVDLV